ncbi:hypothetical protein MalM25_06920 [Planctomycetes bacterium MalM25]|nr:hypothetical protein MalM25_06920 [Planctomycetes bacterium MalM25]
MVSVYFAMQWMTLASLPLTLLLLLSALFGKRSSQHRWLIVASGLGLGAFVFTGLVFLQSARNGVFPVDSSLALPFFCGTLSILSAAAAWMVARKKSIDTSHKHYSLTGLLLLTTLIAIQIAIYQVGVEIGSSHQAEFWEAFDIETASNPPT